MKPSKSSSDLWEPWMRRALQLASLGEGYTSPNPLVGAVIINGMGKLVGEGFHSRAGNPHAEVEAIAQAGDQANGGTLVVTLEPCCHLGRTPPCTDAVVSAGIRRVVIAINDPDSRVAGAGVTCLREAGLEVITGVLAAAATYQNRAFLHRVKNGRPWGTLKWAMSLDGRTALLNGNSRWISGLEARSWVHRLRAHCDAVIVGGGTVRSDDPLLTSRGRRKPEPLRVVLSRSLDLPAKAHLWDTDLAPTLLAHGPEAELDRLVHLADGPERIALPFSEPFHLLQALAERNCNRVLWECGPSLAAAAIQQGCVQELVVVASPKLLGGLPARTPLGDLGFTSMDQVLVLEASLMHRIGADLIVHSFLPQG